MIDLSEPKVEDVYAELFHYTDRAGLKGIWTTGTLWATRYDCLNDASESRHLSEVLREPVVVRVRKRLIEEKRSSLRTQRLVQKAGGVDRVAKADGPTFLRIMCETTFGSAGEDGLSTPYISSFCTHDQEY